MLISTWVYRNASPVKEENEILWHGDIEFQKFQVLPKGFNNQQNGPGQLIIPQELLAIIPDLCHKPFVIEFENEEFRIRVTFKLDVLDEHTTILKEPNKITLVRFKDRVYDSIHDYFGF